MQAVVGSGVGARGDRVEPVPQIFIGKVPPGLPVSVLEAQLAPYEATNVRQLDGKGCAFANFLSWAAAERAITALNGLRLAEGHEGLNVKLADQKGAPKGREGKPKLFFGGLVPSTSEDYLHQICSGFGSVAECKIFAKNATSPPCGFVTFTTFSEAENCIAAMHGQESEICTPGKTLNVRFAENAQNKGPVIGGGAGPALVGGPAAAPQYRGLSVGAPPPMVMHHQARSMPHMGGGMVVGGGFQSHVAPPPPRVGGGMIGGCVGGGMGMGMGGMSGQTTGTRVGRPGDGSGAPPPPGCSEKLFIGGLPLEASEDFIWGIMAPYGEVVEAKLHRKQGAAPCGFIRFSMQQEADVAIALLSQAGRYTVKYADNNRNGPKRSHQAAFGQDEGIGSQPEAGYWG